MTTKTYWRGYIDAQDKRDYMKDIPIATSERRKPLEPLAEIFKTTVQEYRSGYMVILHKLDERLPVKKDADYIRGWFAAQGTRYKEPLKLTVSGENIKIFTDLVKQLVEVELPKPQTPSRTSKSKRVTVTGEKAATLDNFLRATA